MSDRCPWATCFSDVFDLKNCEVNGMSDERTLHVRPKKLSPTDNFDALLELCQYEPCHEKTGSLHMRKQRRRSAVQ